MWKLLTPHGTFVTYAITAAVSADGLWRPFLTAIGQALELAESRTLNGKVILVP